MERDTASRAKDLNNPPLRSFRAHKINTGDLVPFSLDMREAFVCVSLGVTAQEAHVRLRFPGKCHLFMEHLLPNTFLLKRKVVFIFIFNESSPPSYYLSVPS